MSTHCGPTLMRSMTKKHRRSPQVLVIVIYLPGSVIMVMKLIKVVDGSSWWFSDSAYTWWAHPHAQQNDPTALILSRTDTVHMESVLAECVGYLCI